MKNKAIHTLRLNSVSISNLSAINGGLQNNQQPLPPRPTLYCSDFCTTIYCK